MLARQDAVASTSQLQDWGVTRSLMSRRVLSGEWQQLWRGVVVLHSGEITWRQRARGALMYAGADAALSHRAAAFVHGIVRTPGPVLTVSVPVRRAVRGQPGLVVRRRRTMPFAAGDLRAVGIDQTVLDLLDEVTDEDEAVAVVCDAVRCGVLPGRVLLHAAQRPRLRHRALLIELLSEAGSGTESPLEHRYARDVERRHGLPTASAQLRQQIEGRWIRADRVHVGLGVRIELDGRLAHPFGRTDDDTWRDNAVLIAHSEVTLRYRWRHVATQPCATAAQVAAALRSRGWPGHARRCSPTCAMPPA